ncbi:MAG: hypothetical protein F6J89_14680 [Symploca sp. SIO1C4]|uniref:Uncharacterized protein n=1 Tax=Symploca sp. SIO1C4 TaxID=2607765 RepID=A0A6B3N6V9_9CYAN|nr:hypothetical protein [Symploca sp. SIO1C4]
MSIGKKLGDSSTLEPILLLKFAAFTLGWLIAVYEKLVTLGSLVAC